MIRKRNGSPIFYELLDKMADIHDRKSHDYASNSNPYGNYEFAGKLSKLFDNTDDAGFVSRIGEKLYRLANLENGNKKPSNESIEDTEVDICTIIVLWMASRKDRRNKEPNALQATKLDDSAYTDLNDLNPSRNTLCYFCGKTVFEDTVIKIISGKYKQAHVHCWTTCMDTRILEQFSKI